MRKEGSIPLRALKAQIPPDSPGLQTWSTFSLFRAVTPPLFNGLTGISRPLWLDFLLVQSWWAVSICVKRTFNSKAGHTCYCYWLASVPPEIAFQVLVSWTGRWNPWTMESECERVRFTQARRNETALTTWEGSWSWVWGSVLLV